MVQPLHPRFLEERAEYEASERFWRAMFQELAVRTGGEADWRPWRPRTYVNGLPYEEDGNPIFDALNDRLGRAIQVTQWPVEGDAVDIVGWIARVPVEAIDEVRWVPELTISLSLTVESAAVAKHLLATWMDETTTVEAMQSLLDEVARPGRPGSNA